MRNQERNEWRRLLSAGSRINARSRDVLWLLGAADQRDRAVELLRETESWPAKDWQERRDALLEEVSDA